MRTKMLSYRRADFIVDGNGPLETYLIEAHKKFPNIEHRTIQEENNLVLECRNFIIKPRVAIFLHIAAYTPGEPASVVPKIQGVSSGDLGIAVPPDGCEFMDGDSMALVAGNHVILCSSFLHESQTERYMCRIVEKAALCQHAENFKLSKVADIDKVALIKNQGVKSISFDASLQSASLDHLERTTLNKRLVGGVADQLLALIKKDDDGLDLDKAENLSVKLSLSFDMRKKDYTFGREKLEGMADTLIGENDAGFSIETLSGQSIKGDDIVLRKKITLPKHGKTVYCKDAWAEMENYYLELKEGGLLEQ
jgi:hypothetical protein